GECKYFIINTIGELSFSVFRISVGDDKKIVLTANLFAKSSTIFYQQQCCLKTATIACFFSKKQAELRSLVISAPRSGR
ncbi:MAG: hypothetical protein IIU64_07210, partial [Alistipes sp.]|nr:hypothetical protein [Alistipes sp.]